MCSKGKIPGKCSSSFIMLSAHVRVNSTSNYMGVAWCVCGVLLHILSHPYIAECAGGPGTSNHF